MFSLESQDLTLTNFNPRAELEGNDTKPAADLALQLKTSNVILSEFGPLMLDSFYYKSGAPADQGELIDPISDKPNLKNRGLGPISHSWEGVGYTLEIELGASGKKSSLELGECKVNKIRFDMQEGGTVVVTFRVQCHPDEKASGKLCGLIGQEIRLSLTPPALEELKEAA